MSLIYEAINICKKYGQHTALFLPRFQLEKGEAVAVVGPNGSGKSTLLRILAFLENPTFGNLSFFGEEPRRQITLLLQEPYLFKETVFSNVTLGLSLRKQRAELQERYTQAMRNAGFNEPIDFMRRYPGQLSGGEKQRVALASRLILNPTVLLLDEPTSNVDQKSAAVIGVALKGFLDSGGSLVCATHSYDIIATLACRVVQLGEAS